MMPASAPLFVHAAFDVVVIGTSLGGQSALRELLSSLPPHFPAPIVVACHLSPDSPGYVVDNLARSTRLHVKFAEPFERMRPGTVYVAPPDRHVTITQAGECVLSQGERVNYCRPSVDVLFASAAGLGGRALALVLTGCLYDGARGASAIRSAGGVVLAQDPVSCRAPGMPMAAMGMGAVHVAVPLSSLTDALISLVMVAGGRLLFGLGSAA